MYLHNTKYNLFSLYNASLPLLCVFQDWWFDTGEPIAFFFPMEEHDFYFQASTFSYVFFSVHK